jgi:ribosome-associated translation inhibitor RaiA
VNVRDLKQYQSFEPDKDTKAFIYQQVHDLEQEIKGLGDVTVLVEKLEERDEQSEELVSTRFAVTFIIDPEGMNLVMQGDHEDLISACIQAKNKLKRKLQKMMNLSQAEERNQAIDNVISSNGYLH